MYEKLERDAAKTIMSAELSAAKREVSLPAAGLYFVKLTAGDRANCANKNPSKYSAFTTSLPPFSWAPALSCPAVAKKQ